MIYLPPNADILPPVDDHIFKILLTHPEAKPVLTSVLSAAMDRRVVDAVVRNNELPVGSNEEKAERFDVNCVLDDGDQADVEMHASHIEEPDGRHQNFNNKYIYYLTDLHASQKSKGVKYYDLVRTYQITFCNYTIYPNWKDFITRASLRRANGEEISDQINFIIIELSKLTKALKKPPDQLTALEMWSIFFRFAQDPKRRDMVNKVIAQKEEIAMASALLLEVSQDERERAQFRSRRMYETDLQSNLLTAEARGITIGEARGITIGEARGITIGLYEVARNMKKRGMSLTEIAALTNLPLKEVEKI